jgi:hypothetical protein
MERYSELQEVGQCACGEGQCACKTP